MFSFSAEVVRDAREQSDYWEAGIRAYLQETVERSLNLQNTAVFQNAVEEMKLKQLNVCD